MNMVGDTVGTRVIKFAGNAAAKSIRKLVSVRT